MVAVQQAVKAGLSACALTLAIAVSTVSAQQPVLKLAATSANVSEPGQSVRIDINRWSTDPERRQLVNAMIPPAPAEPPQAATAPPAAAAGEAARGGDGGGRGARGGGVRGGRGAAGRGGAAGPPDPIAALTDSIRKSQTVGFIWTNEVAGYSIKYAFRFPSAGGERIILVTDRRLGAHALSWNPVAGTPNSYEFTLVEIRLNSQGSGEARTSLTSSVAVDRENNTIALENYAAAPVILQNVKSR